MLFVCLSHFIEIYADNSGAAMGGVFLVTMVASPAFIAINGIMLGFFRVKYRDNFCRIRADFINRGVFLLTAGRLLISLAHVLRSGGFIESLKWVFITDVIAVNLIVGPFLIALVRPLWRIFLGVFCMLVTWMSVLWWLPEPGIGEVVKEMVFGSLQYSAFHYVFPLLPWFGLYLISTTIGEALGRVAFESGDPRQFVRRLAIAGGACVFLGFLARPVMGILAVWDILPGSGALTQYSLWSPAQKSPPSIPFFAFYGGLGVLMVCTMLYLDLAGRLTWYLRLFAVLGRASLFVFILQYYVYFTVLYAMDPGYSILWPIYFLFSMLLIWLFARNWDERGLNRWLTAPLLRCR